MRGSSHSRSRSETRVPITVRKLRIMIIDPARYISWLCSERSKSGPVVGKPRTTATITDPDTMLGSNHPTVLMRGIQGHAHRILENQSDRVHALGPCRLHIFLRDLVQQIAPHDSDESGSSFGADDDHRNPQMGQQIGTFSQGPGGLLVAGGEQTAGGLCQNMSNLGT